VDISRDDILREFEVEAEEHLDGMEQALVALDRKRDDEELRRGLFRSAHTLKGAAACVGFTAMTQFAHALEDLLEQLWQKTVPLSDDLISMLLRAVDEWRTMVPAAMSGTDELSGAQVSILGTLARYASEHRVVDSASEQVVPSPVANAGSSAVDATNSGGRRRTLRVSVSELDRLVNLTGEIAIARSRTGNLLARGGGQSIDAVRDAHVESERLYLELQEQVMKLRMVPMGPTFRQHIRTVRDVAVARGKQAQLVLDGEDVEVDMAVLEALRDPLTHLVRNAVDHGIEPPAVRYEKHKDLVGVVTLRAHYESGSVEIQVIDDGAGLDRSRILARARELGLVAGETTPTDEEILHFIFAPGFSTALEVTEISGRGMGLDIVDRNIDSLRGSVSVSSVMGQGTKISMRVPLTLGIVQGFSVGVGAETYILPLESVVGCIELPAAERANACSRGVINLRGRVLPYVRLRDVFGVAAAPSARESVVVIRHGEGEAGIAVDFLYGEGQTVVKPLARVLRTVPGIFGSALLGDGRVALIVDVAGLMRMAVSGHGGGRDRQNQTVASGAAA
jgi:two-component system, chemotaxis family, sensor kinase CheA